MSKANSCLLVPMVKSRSPTRSGVECGPAPKLKSSRRDGYLCSHSVLPVAASERHDGFFGLPRPLLRAAVAGAIHRVEPAVLREDRRVAGAERPAPQHAAARLRATGRRDRPTATMKLRLGPPHWRHAAPAAGAARSARAAGREATLTKQPRARRPPGASACAAAYPISCRATTRPSHPAASPPTSVTPILTSGRAGRAALQQLECFLIESGIGREAAEKTCDHGDANIRIPRLRRGRLPDRADQQAPAQVDDQGAVRKRRSESIGGPQANQVPRPAADAAGGEHPEEARHRHPVTVSARISWTTAPSARLSRTCFIRDITAALASPGNPLKAGEYTI